MKKYPVKHYFAPVSALCPSLNKVFQDTGLDPNFVFANIVFSSGFYTFTLALQGDKWASSIYARCPRGEMPTCEALIRQAFENRKERPQLTKVHAATTRRGAWVTLFVYEVRRITDLLESLSEEIKEAGTRMESRDFEDVCLSGEKLPYFDFTGEYGYNSVNLTFALNREYNGTRIQKTSGSMPVSLYRYKWDWPFLEQLTACPLKDLKVQIANMQTITHERLEEKIVKALGG